jgi:DNA invertase Pin-like site-specific DNA recombinase
VWTAPAAQRNFKPITLTGDYRLVSRHGPIRVFRVPSTKNPCYSNAVIEAGYTKIFTKQMSGAVTGRPALHDALEFARSGGDTLMVWKVDRLARSMKQLIETVESLRLRGIGLRSLAEALDTTTAQGRLVLHMFGALAEFERSLIRERATPPLSGRSA